MQESQNPEFPESLGQDQEDKTMTKLVKYIVEPNMLTLTILLENGEEIVVPISGTTVPNRMSLDIIHTMYYEDDGTGPTIRKITCTIDPRDGAILSSDVEEEENVK
jgi:hypothetical protein